MGAWLSEWLVSILVDQEAGPGLLWKLISASQAWCPEDSMSFPDSGTCWRGVPTHELVGHFTLKPEQQRRLKMLGLQIVS